MAHLRHRPFRRVIYYFGEQFDGSPSTSPATINAGFRFREICQIPCFCAIGDVKSVFRSLVYERALNSTLIASYSRSVGCSKIRLTVTRANVVVCEDRVCYLREARCEENSVYTCNIHGEGNEISITLTLKYSSRV